MEVGLRLQPHTRAWLKQSALDAHVSEYWAYLEVHGYAASTQRVYLGCVAHFAHWMRLERLGLKRLDEDAVARYLAEHLPRCNCPEPVRWLVHQNRAALAHLLATLRASSTITEPTKPYGHIESDSIGSTHICGRPEDLPATRGSNGSRSFGVSSCPASSARDRLCRPG
jgi:hypothetical protein